MHYQLTVYLPQNPTEARGHPRSDWPLYSLLKHFIRATLCKHLVLGAPKYPCYPSRMFTHSMYFSSQAKTESISHNINVSPSIDHHGSSTHRIQEMVSVNSYLSRPMNLVQRCFLNPGCFLNLLSRPRSFYIESSKRNASTQYLRSDSLFQARIDRAGSKDAPYDTPESLHTVVSVAKLHRCHTQLPQQFLPNAHVSSLRHAPHCYQTWRRRRTAFYTSQSLL